MKQPQERSTRVISLWPRVCGQTTRPHGTFEIPAAPICEFCQKSPCREHMPHSVYVVRKAMEWVDEGNDRYHKHFVDDQELAVDLASVVEHFGVLAIEGDEPTIGEIEQARDALDAYLKNTLELEDKVYSVTGRAYNREHAMIACTWFGVERDWQADTRPKVACPACKSMNVPESVKCGSASCGAILDWDKALEFGMLDAAMIAHGERMGKFTSPPTGGKGRSKQVQA